MIDAVNGKIAIIGLGYVGLPLAVEFGKNRDVMSDVADLKDARIFIVTVPSPIDTHKQPDLTPLKKASETVGAVLKKGDLVIYESTVYPGATEDECIPVLERVSGLTFNVDFFAGYSPERVNPGDPDHKVHNILKVTSGSTPEVATQVDALYNEIITAGTHKAASIKVAEAAKVIENTQRDLNIALINELAIIFNKMGIDTDAVLKAAGTKWNFLPFRPGLVGGHCIGVDPYYLTHKAEAIGYHPEMKIHVQGARVLVMGLTFKENCPDLRNTRVVDVLAELADYGVEVDVHDPWADAEEARAEYGIDLVKSPQEGTYDGIIYAVAHSSFVEGGANPRAYGKSDHVLYDLKNFLPRDMSDLRL